MDSTSQNSEKNNFLLIRILAATLVVVSHSFKLTGFVRLEPIGRFHTGFDLGYIAVDAFFVTSGFLLASSLQRQPSMMRFVAARILRIYPALCVSIMLTALFVGTCITELSWKDFWFSDKTWHFIFHDASIVGIDRTTFDLPGAFAHQRSTNVNGSLWTLPFELQMYWTIVMLFAFAVLTRSYRDQVFKFLVFLVVLVSLFFYSYLYYSKIINTLDFDDGANLWRLGYMFFSGAAYALCRQRIRFYGLAGIILFLLCGLSIVDGKLFFAIYNLGFPYMLLCLAYYPGKFLLRFNRFGDYSYGIYIYAYPVQQSLLAFHPHSNPLTLFISSFCITLMLAMASWHLVEKPCLSLKKMKFQRFRLVSVTN